MPSVSAGFSGEPHAQVRSQHQGRGVAVSLAVSAIPLLGAAGVALGYSRTLTVRTFLQQQSDTTALGAGQDGLPSLRWEDRSPETGWSDPDYDDIRIVIGCPSWLRGAGRGVWLVR